MTESVPTLSRDFGKVDRERVKAQMRRWQDRVLDLTKSNPLIGLNRSRAAKLSIITPDARTLYTTLLIDEIALMMPLVRRRKHRAGHQLTIDSNTDAEIFVEPGDVTFDAPPAEVMRRLRRVHDNARTSLEERGVTTLYLTLGALHWQDETFGDSVSPLLMVPCEFESKGPEIALRLRPADEDSQINPALEYYLRERHKVNLPALPDEMEKDSLATVLGAIRRTVQEQKWVVTEEAWLGTFSFESLVIYNDLRALIDAAGEHPVVAALAHATVTSGAPESLPGDLDSLPTPGTVPIPVLSTDSSQLEALALASSGNHVVVHGPPGTGKSQTIANLIADAMTRNLKVLFVSAKMAALNVVYDRLKELGLQRFCLEAHSTKAGKQKIIDELRRTLEAEVPVQGDALERELQSLLRVREDLNGYARALHTPIPPLGLSLYRANGRLAQLAAVPDVRSPLPWATPFEVLQDKLDSCLQALDELASMTRVFDQRQEHPWSGFVAERFGLAEQESLELSLMNVFDLNQRLGESAAKIANLVPDARDLALSDWMLLRDALSALTDIDRLPENWWSQSDEDLTSLASMFETASGHHSELLRISEAVSEASELTFASLFALLSPIQQEFARWHARLNPSYWRWRRQVQSALRSGVQFSRDGVGSLHRLCGRAVEIQRWMDEQSPTIESYVRQEARQDPTALTAMGRAFTVAALCRKTLTALGRAPGVIVELNTEFRAAVVEILEILSDAGPTVLRAFEQLDSHWPNGFVGSALASHAPMPQVAARAESLRAAMSQAREWVLFLRAMERCAALGLAPFLEAFGATSASEAPRIFERRFLRLWVSTVLDQTPILGAFTEAKGQDLLEKFRALDGRVQRLAIARAQVRASSASNRVRMAQDVQVGASEISTLRYELQKKRRIKPLRKLFAEIPHVLQALKPCLLMSPISVSTYLKPDVCHFDLVVFDEASQLPTAESVPAILRATQVVVAGDPKQLPPTSFFETSLVPSDEDEDAEDSLGQVPLESLLDDCVAVVPVFRESYLRWHYRSRDEHLIKFSNHFFYDNRLITFPAASVDAPGQGVRLVHVPDGVYDRGRSRTNRREAHVVARLAVEHFEHFPERSLGIVAMGLSQKEAIEDAIAEELATRPDLEPFLDRTRHEAFLMKSLENVQGDERDTMIISVGYGRDPEGGLSMNFGPINTDGGWRRLNVLVTRAKWECVLVSSLKASELSDVNPNNRGAIALRSFLEFAERGGDLPAEPAAPTAGETNDFEDAVRAALVDRGLKVEAQVGASRYRIDLAVRDRHDTRRYALGIECDGVAYHSSRTARDRDLLRQHVLQGMGWRIHRVWSTEWFHDPDQVVEGILRSLEQAEVNRSGPPVWAPQVDSVQGANDHLDLPSEKPSPSPPPGRKYNPGVPYSIYRPSRQLGREILLNEGFSKMLADTIAEIVRAEGPIHYEVLVERLKELHDIHKAGSNVRANVDQALRFAQRNRTITHEPRSKFYFAPDLALEGYRTATAAIKRPIEHIAPSEIAQAILFLVEDQFSLVEESAPIAVARLFGIERLRSDGADLIRSTLDDLVNKGLLRRGGTQVYLA